MIKICTKCKQPMKQRTRGFKMQYVCKCGEMTDAVSIKRLGIKKTIPIIMAGRGTGRSRLC